MTDRERFRAEALETRRQEVPEELEWVPWRELPSRRWRDGTPVDELIPRGWLVAADDWVVDLQA